MAVCRCLCACKRAVIAPARLSTTPVQQAAPRPSGRTQKIFSERHRTRMYTQPRLADGRKCIDGCYYTGYHRPHFADKSARRAAPEVPRALRSYRRRACTRRREAFGARAPCSPAEVLGAESLSPLHGGGRPLRVVVRSPSTLMVLLICLFCLSK